MTELASSQESPHTHTHSLVGSRHALYIRATNSRSIIIIAGLLRRALFVRCTAV